MVALSITVLIAVCPFSGAYSYEVVDATLKHGMFYLKLHPIGCMVGRCFAELLLRLRGRGATLIKRPESSKEVRRIVLGVLFLIICGCGGGSSAEEPAHTTSFAGAWGYDDATTKIRAMVVAPDDVRGYSGLIQFEHTHAVPVYDVTFQNIIGWAGNYTATSDQIIYSASVGRGSGGGLAGGAAWADHQDTGVAGVVLIPVDAKSRLDCRVQNGFMGMSTATYTLTRR
jgi:hypothetical protein